MKNTNKCKKSIDNIALRSRAGARGVLEPFGSYGKIIKQIDGPTCD